MENLKEIVLEDSFVVAALSELSRLLPPEEQLFITPFKKSSNKIAWRVGGNVMPLLERIYQNEKIGISDYIRALKTVRSSIFVLKQVNEGAGGITRHGENQR